MSMADNREWQYNINARLQPTQLSLCSTISLHLVNTNRVIYATAGAAAGVVLATVIAPLVLPPAGFGALRPSK